MAISVVEVMDVFRQSIIGSFLFLLGTLLAASAYYYHPATNLLLAILTSIILLSMGVKILASSNVPVLKFLTGISFSSALFEQANVSGGYVSLIMAIIILAASFMECRKDIVRAIKN